jgi:hypothetical protein
LPDFNNAEKKGEKYILKTLLPDLNNAEKRCEKQMFQTWLPDLTIPKKTKKKGENKCFRHGCQIITMPKKGRKIDVLDMVAKS